MRAKDSRKKRASLRQACCFAVSLGVLGLFSMLAVPVRSAAGPAQDPSRQGILSLTPQDAQSTTGPTPPPGVLLRAPRANPEQAVIIAGVPAYIWQHGCGPTAAGMILGYWDGQGFDFLIPGDAQSQTPDVDAVIATEGPASNYTDYCVPEDSYPNLLPDKSEDPPGDEHMDNCVADYMKTSRSANFNYYGWSWASHVGPAMESYVGSLGQPDVVVTTETVRMGSTLTFDTFREEIDAGRPMVLLVDTNGDDNTDHFVTAIGYEDEVSPPRYACLNTWDQDIHWYDFEPMDSGQPWGVWGGTTFRIERVVCSVVANARGPDVPVCPWDEAVLSGSGSMAAGCADGLEYQWRDPVDVVCPWQTEPECSVYPFETTVYTLEARCVGKPDCADSAEVVLEVGVLPEPLMGENPRELCLGQATQFGEGPGDPAFSYLWDPPDYLSYPAVADPIFFAQVLGDFIYTLTVTDRETGCLAQDQLTLSVIDGVPSGFVGNTLIAFRIGDAVSLTWVELNIPNYNLHRTDQKSDLNRFQYHAPVLSDVTGSEIYVDPDAVTADDSLLFYQVYGRDCDGRSVMP